MSVRLSESFLLGLSGKGEPRHLLGSPVLKAPLKQVLRLGRLDRVYASLPKAATAQGFLERIIERFRFRLETEPEDVRKIPESGPAVIVANHPFGGVEGLLLASLLLSRRKDVKILANPFMAALPELGGLFILTDPYADRRSPHKNVKALREAVGWLSQGGLLVVFPAGEVSHLRLRERVVSDPPWQPGVLYLVKKTGTPVWPVFFQGRNGAWFQVAGLVHPQLRTALLPREFLNKEKKAITLRIGNRILPSTLSALPDDAARLDYLRRRTETLRYRKPSPSPPRPDTFFAGGTAP